MALRESISKHGVGEVLVAVCRAHRNRAAALLASVGVYVGQEWVLFQLRREDGATLSALAESCGIETPTMSRGLQRMESAGLVVKRDDPHDARVSRIFLTKAGRAVADQAMALWGELERETVKGLSTEERILLRRLLLQVKSNLDE